MTRLCPVIQKRRAFFIASLLIVCAVFTADILDLREDLRFIPCPYSSLDNNVTTGLTTSTDYETEPLFVLRSVDQTSSVKVSFLHLLPFGFRAPPVSL